MMLRPLKSILTYLQLNTNASSSEMSQEESHIAAEVAPIEGSSENNFHANNINTNEIFASPKSPLKVTPHDQNENEVAISENASPLATGKKGEGCSSAILKPTAIEVVDISDTTEENFKRQDKTDSNKTMSSREIHGEAIDLEAGETAGDTVGEHDRSGSSIFSENVQVLSDEEKETDESDVCIVEENIEQRADIDQIVLSDNENAEEEESKNERIDLSLESNEVIILEEIDHNDSFSDPLNDPLAIDDYTADPNSSLVTACSSRGHSDPSNEGELLFEIETRAELGTSNSKAGCKLTHRNKHNSLTEAIIRDVNREEHEARSDGSDSGLGLETSNLQSNNSSIAADSPVCKPPPAKGNLKRRSDEAVESTSNKRAKSSLNFNGVKVYYFPRIQGFGCVPSQGGCTLGMAAHHVQMKTFSLAEHTAEQRRVHKQQMQETNPRTSSSDETDSDEEISEASGSDLDADASGFLQPVSPRQRRAILKAAGIRKIDSTEKDECRSIRSSREFCGCSCRGYCDPDTCSCSQSGIKCQVDRPSFPCGCTRDGCANVVGRVEFNPSRVRTHYIHTIMRLDIENKQKRAIDMDTCATSSQILNYNSNTATSTLSSLCNYNSLVSTNHMRHQQQLFNSGPSGSDSNVQHQPHDTYANRNHDLYPGVASSILTSSNSSINASTATLLRQRLLEQSGNNGRQINSSRNTNERFAIDISCGSSRGHELDLHYEFRADTGTTVDLTSPGATNDLLGLGDFNPTTSAYQETYNGHSFLNQNYSNPTFCQPQNISAFQQSFIGYVPPSETAIEIADLTAEVPVDSTKAGGTLSETSFMNINSPTSNQCQMDVVKNYLQNHRDITVTEVVAPLTSVDTSTKVSYNMAPSAQTSTSITEGTLTTVTPPKVAQSTKIFCPITSKVDIVDLTDRLTPEQEKSTQIDLNSSSEDIIEIFESGQSAQKERPLIADSSSEIINAAKSNELDNQNIERLETSGTVLDSLPDVDLTISENTSISSTTSIEENLIVGTAIA